MNRPIRVMAIGCLLLFVALMLNVNYLQYIRADELNARNDNRRVLVEEYSRERGPIVVAGEPIASSEPVDDEYEYQRTYDDPGLYSNLTGFYSFTFGSTDLENSQNGILSGSDPQLFVNRVVDLVSRDQPSGGSVELTIDPDAQQAAADGFAALAEGSRGAAVALDPDTGAVLAMVSTPAYNTNQLASHDFEEVDDFYQRLLQSEAAPLVDRSREERYAPGSTFKLVTAAAALSDDELDLSPDSQIESGSALSFPDGGSYVLTNQSDDVCGAQEISFTQALAFSCNTAFGRLALAVGPEDLAEQAEAFGFGDNSYLDSLQVAASQFTSGDPAELDSPQTAQSGIGQFDVAATPLQMAMVTATIANGGTVMRPFIMSQVRSPDAEVLDRTQPETLYDDAVSDDVAEDLTEMMVATVEDGTAEVLGIDGVSVGGKTGTAQRDEDDNPYAWIVGMAPADDPQVAVAVFIEDAGGTARDDISGGALAGPIAKAVMQAVITP